MAAAIGCMSIPTQLRFAPGAPGSGTSITNLACMPDHGVHAPGTAIEVSM